MESPNTSEFEFLTKRELVERLGNEQIVITPEVEEKLKGIGEDQLLSIEITVRSPAKITDVEILNTSIIDFMNNIFEKEGITKEVVNKVFEGLGRD